MCVCVCVVGSHQACGVKDEGTRLILASLCMCVCVCGGCITVRPRTSSQILYVSPRKEIEIIDDRRIAKRENKIINCLSCLHHMS